MAKCPECGEFNRHDRAVTCHKCGSNLGDNAESSLSDGRIPHDNQDNRVSEQHPESESQQNSDTAEFECTAKVDITEAGTITSKSEFEESEGTDNLSADDDTAKNMFEGTNEIELPDLTETDDADSRSESEEQIPSEQEHDDAVSSDAKSDLMESLRSKIPSMTNGNNSIEKPKRDQESHKHPARSLPKERSFNIASEKVSKQATSPSEMNSNISPPESTNEDKTVQFSGSKLHFNQTMEFSADEQVVFRDTTYNLQPRKRDRKTLALFSALAAVVLLVLISSIVKNGPGMVSASLVGVVVDESTQQVLTDVEITIVETGKTVTTNQDGMFIFEMIPEGTYTLGAKTPFFETAQVTVNHRDTRNSLIAIDLFGSDRADATDKPTVGQFAIEESTSNKNVVRYGVLDIAMQFADAEIFLDNRSYGKGARKIRKIWEGKHKLVVKLDGYKTFEKTFRIKRDETTKVAVELAQLPPDSPPELTAADYIRSGDEAVSAKSYYAAIAEYNEALKLENNTQTYVKRAVAFRAAGHSAEATEDFTRAGRMYASVGQVGSAISALSNALDLNPEHLKALRARGYAYIQRGEYELALVDFKTACERDKNVYDSFVGLGDAYSVLGKYKDAIKAYKNAEKLTDDKSDVYALIALASLSRGKEKDARKYYKKFVEAANPDTEQKYARDPEWQRLKQLASRN